MAIPVNRNENRNIIPKKVQSAPLKYNLTDMNYNDIELNKAHNTTRLINEYLSKTVKGGIEQIGCLNYEVLKAAPKGYFDKIQEVAVELTTLIQESLSRGEKAGIIKAMKDNPTDNSLKKDAFSIINSENLKFDNKFTGDSTGLPDNEKSIAQKYQSLNVNEKIILLAMIVNEICGLGPLEPLYQDFSVREIICNGPFDVQVEVSGKLERIESCKFVDTEHLEALISKLYTSVNKDVSRSNPYEQARLADNSRVFTTHKIMAPGGPNLNIRRHTEDWVSPDDILKFGTMSPEMAEWLGNYIYQGCSFLVNGGTSCGKALIRSTPIPTPYGFVRMGDLQVGDKVFGGDGNVCTVTGVFNQPMKPVYNLIKNNKQVFGCDLEHNWFTSKKGDSQNYQIHTTQEMITGMNNNERYNIPIIPKPVEFNVLDKTVKLLHPYILGLWLVSGDKADNLIYGYKKELDYCVKRINSFNSHFKITYKEDNNNCQVYEITPKEDFIKVIKELKIYNNKNIPGIYEFSSVKSRNELINGIFTLKGYISKTDSSWIFESKNKSVVHCVQRILSSLGNLTSVIEITDKRIFRLCCKTNNILSDLPSKKEFYIRNKKKNFKQFDYIASITSADRQECMRCIQVDSPDNTYLCGYDYTITHNTTLLSALCGFFPTQKRIITIEKNIELKMPSNKMNAMPLECIPKKSSSTNSIEVTMRDLVICTTQMRPDIIICGEVISDEAYDLTQAGNTGHQIAGTVHSNSSQACTIRMMSLISQSKLVEGKEALNLLANSIDFIVTTKRFSEDGSRKIVDISEVGRECKINPENGELYLPVTPIWQFQRDISNVKGITGKFVKVGELSKERMEDKGINPNAMLSLDQLKSLYK